MDETIPALTAPPPAKDHPLTRSVSGMIGMAFLALMILGCVATLPWTLASTSSPLSEDAGLTARYNAGSPRAGRLPPSWWHHDTTDIRRLNELVDREVAGRIAGDAGMSVEDALAQTEGPVAAALRRHWPTYLLGTDTLGRGLFVRVLTGGGISLGIGIAAAFISVCIGTIYGSIAAYVGGRTDALMMRIVDILYGLPYILLVVLLAVASDAALDEYISRAKARDAYVAAEANEVLRAEGTLATRAAVDELLQARPELKGELESQAVTRFPPRRISDGRRTFFDVVVLLVAIGGVSWLTMARVVRGQVLSLKAQPFMEAARAIGVPVRGQFVRHLLPNLLGPIIVYATLTVPQAILQESFLSFLGIGVKPPLPSWGNLAADGLNELNPYQSNWWLLLFPCLLLGTTLLALNFVGEGLREAFDPKRRKVGS